MCLCKISNEIRRKYAGVSPKKHGTCDARCLIPRFQARKNAAEGMKNGHGSAQNSPAGTGIRPPACPPAAQNPGADGGQPPVYTRRKKASSFARAIRFPPGRPLEYCTVMPANLNLPVFFFLKVSGFIVFLLFCFCHSDRVQKNSEIISATEFIPVRESDGEADSVFWQPESRQRTL